MFLHFRDNKEEFMKKFHKRSNVETVFSMIKVRLGEHLRCKNFVSQTNELLMKFICHNITCLIQEMYELGVKVDFNKCNKVYVSHKVPECFMTQHPSKIQK